MKALIASLLLVASAAQAVPYTIEPDDFAPGTNLSHLIPGVTLSLVTMAQTGTTEGGAPFWTPVLSDSVYSHAVDMTPLEYGFSGTIAPTGHQLFGWSPGSDVSTSGVLWGDMHESNCLTIGCMWATVRQTLRIDFDTPTDMVSTLGFFWGGDPTSILAYDSSGQHVALCEQGVIRDGTCVERFQAQGFDGHDASAGWGEVTARSETANISTAFIGGVISMRALDRITFDVVDVPEPGTAALLLAGLPMLMRRSIYACRSSPSSRRHPYSGRSLD